MPLRFGVRAGAVAILIILFGAGFFLQRIDPWWDLAYIGMGTLSALAYGLDKRAAARGAWRVSERTLHGLDLAFGILGGLIAQVAFRHKTSKTSFAIMTGLIYAIHLCVIVVLLSGFDVLAFARHMTG